MSHTSSYRPRRIVNAAPKDIRYYMMVLAVLVEHLRKTSLFEYCAPPIYLKRLMNSCDNTKKMFQVDESHTSLENYMYVMQSRCITSLHFATLRMLQNNRCRISRYSSELLVPRLPIKSGNRGSESMHHPASSPRTPNPFER